MDKDYKKLYKEALERARDLHDNHPLGQPPTWMTCEKIFPELKESEDERIRKELIERFNWELKGAEEQDSADCSRQKDIAMFKRGIAWLEKQGEKKPSVESMEHSYITPNSEFFQWIYDRLVHVHNENPNVDYMLSLKERIEDMQKPDDNVKPKFNVGDWIINNDKRIAIPTQILKIEKYGYVTSMGYTSFDKVKTDYHLWTIQDAKDGDVLFTTCDNTNKMVFIYHGIEFDTTHCYFLYSKTNNGCKTFNSVCSVKADIHPATKEQRELLFSKMKEVGYEWDAEKKELKKIEQKSSWSEEDERICQCLIKDQEKALDDVRNDKYGHSEIISDLKEMYRERIDWLKSLKPNHWKPSKEQLESFEHFVRSIGESGYASPYDNNTKLIYSLLNDLKSL